MGLYLRKSVRVGPFKFNLSGSGVGVSCGIPGLRIGAGPRGNYISAGAGGIYYRAALPGNRTRQPILPPPTAPEHRQETYDPTLSPFHEVDAGISVNLNDVSSKALIDELNEKRQRLRLTPWVVAGLFAICIAMYVANFSALEIILAGLLLLPAIVLASLRDTLKKTSVLMYDLDPTAQLSYAEFTAAFERAATSDRIWHVRSAASVLDRKYHSGASTVIDTDQARLGKKEPPKLKTNIQPLQIALPRRTFYFFPDRILVLDAAGFGAINYGDLQIDIQRSTFITGESFAPRDAKIIEYTWRYVNKRGGPDHRFANNPQLPVIDTRDVFLRSGAGLNAALKFSNPAAAEALHQAVLSFVEKQPIHIGGSREHPHARHPIGEDRATAPKNVAAYCLAAVSVMGVIAVILWHYLTVPQQATREAVSTPAPVPTLNTVPSPFVDHMPVTTLATTSPSISGFETVSPKPTPEFVRLTDSFTVYNAKGRPHRHLEAGKRLRVILRSSDQIVIDSLGEKFSIPAKITVPSK